MGRQKLTKTDEKERATRLLTDDSPEGQELVYRLPPAQETALQALLSGKTITDAAAAAGVQRQTVSAWLNHDCTFIAVYNRRRQQLADEFDGQLRALGAKALKALEAALDGPQQLDAAKAILRTVASLPRPAGPITPADVENEQQQAARDSLLNGLVGVANRI